jgi:hypothetical protein
MAWRWAPDNQEATFLVPLLCDSRLRAAGSSALESPKRVRQFRPPIAAGLAVNFSAGKNRRGKNQKPSRAEINAAIYLLQIKSEKLHRSSHNRIIPTN